MAQDQDLHRALGELGPHNNCQQDFKVPIIYHVLVFSKTYSKPSPWLG